MRKTLALLLGLLLTCLPFAALAQEAPALILTGKVEAGDTATITAPFGGTVQDFTLRAGDQVEAGEALLTLDTIKVYAPCDGIVRGIFAQPGDSAAFVQGRYGALCFIEPDIGLTVAATTAQAYDSAENRILHIGETVYMRAANNNAREGSGRIMGLSGESYSIEVLEGNLEVRDSVNIFRKDDYEANSRIGRGVVARVEPVAVSAEGALLAIHVEEGAEVLRGDLLFEIVSGTLDGMSPVGDSVTAPQDGLVASVAVAPGQAVNKQQPLLTIYPLDRFQLVTAVSELDTHEIAIGDKMRIEFDSIPGTRYDGVVSAISGMGTPTENYTEYTVYIDFTPDEAVRLGMSGTAYPD